MTCHSRLPAQSTTRRVICDADGTHWTLSLDEVRGVGRITPVLSPGLVRRHPDMDPKHWVIEFPCRPLNDRI